MPPHSQHLYHVPNKILGGNLADHLAVACYFASALGVALGKAGIPSDWPGVSQPLRTIFFVYHLIAHNVFLAFQSISGWFYSFNVNKLVMKEEGGTRVAWYWFTAGNKVTDNYYLQQIYIALNGLLKGYWNGALIRVSTFVKSNNSIEADNKIKDFVDNVVEILYKKALL